jgi:GNAT superfamily N-acetyltransferase
MRATIGEEVAGVPAEPRLLIADLAPGDRVETTRDWSDLRVHRVRDVADPDFALAYDRLWREFGPRGEMERHAVIRERLAWDPARPLPDAALAYELLVLRFRGEVAALRDHTAVVRLDARGRPLPGPVVVHLSHAFVEPAHRGHGLAAWLRALPLQTARRCAAAAGADPGRQVVLVAEMEPPDPGEPGRLVRLRSYERAGFQKVDPVVAPYAQPDFRPPELLAGAPPKPVPLGLVLRRVGRESDDSMSAGELAAVVQAIYAVYAVHVPAVALEPLRAAAASWTARQPSFRLLPPTS